MASRVMECARRDFPLILPVKLVATTSMSIASCVRRTESRIFLIRITVPCIIDALMDDAQQWHALANCYSIGTTVIAILLKELFARRKTQFVSHLENSLGWEQFQ